MILAAAGPERALPRFRPDSDRIRIRSTFLGRPAAASHEREDVHECRSTTGVRDRDGDRGRWDIHGVKGYYGVAFADRN